MEIVNGVCHDSTQDRVNFCGSQEGSGEGSLFQGEGLPSGRASLVDGAVE